MASTAIDRTAFSGWRLFWLLVTVAFLGGASAALPHAGATGIVKERMDHMKSIKDAMKGLAPIMKGDVAYDVQAVREYARSLSSKGGAAMTTLFPQGSIHGPSEALPAIWTDWSRFEDSARELEQSAALLAANAGNERDGSSADPWTAFQRVVGTCRGCHEDFRKD